MLQLAILSLVLGCLVAALAYPGWRYATRRRRRRRADIRARMSGYFHELSQSPRSNWR